MRLIVVILTATAFLAGYLMNESPPPPEPLKLEGTGWCYYADFASLADYETTRPLPHSFIDVHARGVRVYGRCE